MPPSPGQDHNQEAEPVKTTDDAGASTSSSIPFLAATLTAEWPKKAADMVDLVVDTVHDRVIRPVMIAARAVVFGFIIALMVLVVFVLLAILLLRLLDNYFFADRVWASYAVIGGVFTIGGFVAWHFRVSPQIRSHSNAAGHGSGHGSGSGR